MKKHLFSTATFVTLLTCGLLVGAAQAQAADDTLTIYSARNEQLLTPLLDSFTQETGIKTRLHTDKEGALLARLQSEGARTPADVLITVDAGNLWQAANLGLLSPVSSPVLTQNIPAHLRDPSNLWFGLSVRARTIVYNKKTVQPSDLSTYQALAESKWKAKLCLRTSAKVYNQSLIAMQIAEHGVNATEKMVKDWVANLATAPFADDTALIKAIASGQCQVGIVNTYYLGRLLVANPELPVGLFWANQADSGVHVNVSGAGVVKHSKQAKNAQKLLEFLSSTKAQLIYTDKDLEFPANASVKPSSIIKAWGEFKPNLINVARAGELQAVAVRLMDRAGYK